MLRNWVTIWLAHFPSHEYLARWLSIWHVFFVNDGRWLCWRSRIPFNNDCNGFHLEQGLSRSSGCLPCRGIVTAGKRFSIINGCPIGGHGGGFSLRYKIAQQEYEVEGRRALPNDDGWRCSRTRRHLSAHDRRLSFYGTLNFCREKSESICEVTSNEPRMMIGAGGGGVGGCSHRTMIFCL